MGVCVRQKLLKCHAGLIRLATWEYPGRHQERQKQAAPDCDSRCCWPVARLCMQGCGTGVAQQGPNSHENGC